ncbi:MAG: LysM peptidoglycan-binding domain-containing protein, partial [Mixta calida]|nr:LysM peptidoglycan-binding domain-containing protein [Mixta calida]
MSMGSPLFTLSRVAAVSLIGFWLAGCTSDDNTQAPISTVGSQSQSGGGGMLTSGGGMTNGSVPSRPVFSSSANSSNANVTTQNGRIVYNRSYENIPKGSYSGDTYTVKRGDTLFYIAWITGNDFRDLAQRNNIAA